jgi:hypothetical protein
MGQAYGSIKPVSARRVLHRFLRGQNFRTASLPPNYEEDVTGVDNTTIWISTKEAYGAQIQHGPRIKVKYKNKWHLIEVKGNPEIPSQFDALTREALRNFIKLNTALLQSY